jgi:hypothetical protein
MSITFYSIFMLVAANIQSKFFTEALKDLRT